MPTELSQAAVDQQMRGSRLKTNGNSSILNAIELLTKLLQNEKFKSSI